MDELDRRAIEALRMDPRVSYAGLGKRLGVSGMTAATRLNRLRATGVLRFQAGPNLAQFGLGTQVLGFVQGEIAIVPVVAAMLQASPYVLRVDRVTGEFDLSFHAVFPSEATLGALLRELQAVEGLRRLMVHHVLDTLKLDDGWTAVFVRPPAVDDAPFELASGTQVPKALEAAVALAAEWVDALAKADLPRLRGISTPDIVFQILPPHPSAGTFDGMEAVEQQAERTRRAYNRLWYRIVGVREAPPPYTVVIDALSPVETHRGRVGTAFSRMAFAFADGRVSRALSLGQMELPDVPG